MPFRWFQALRLLTPALFFPVGLAMVYRPEFRGLAAFPVVVLCAAGALLGLVFLFTGVRFRCPFCRAWGRGAIEGNGRPRLECSKCGEIRCEGLLGLRITSSSTDPATSRASEKAP